MPKISDYPEVTSPADDQYMVVDGSNGTKKVSIASLKNKFNGGQSSDTPDVTLQTNVTNETYTSFLARLFAAIDITKIKGSSVILNVQSNGRAEVYHICSLSSAGFAMFNFWNFNIRVLTVGSFGSDTNKAQSITLASSYSGPSDISNNTIPSGRTWEVYY